MSIKQPSWPFSESLIHQLLPPLFLLLIVIIPIMHIPTPDVGMPSEGRDEVCVLIDTIV